MHPPFTSAEFFDVFRHYNDAVWPAQIALLLVAAFAAFAAVRANIRESPRWGRAAIASLALLWLWSGIVFHKVFFLKLTPMGEVFGSLFIAEAALLLICAWLVGPPVERASTSSVVVAGLLLTYALVVYPLVGHALGQHYPAVPSFGAPCPVTIFTFAIVCLLPTSFARFALAIPIVWTAIASYAAVEFGVGEDIGLPLAALATLFVLTHEAHRPFMRPFSVR